MKVDRLCHGRDCYLQIPGVCTNNPETVVPCHSNQLKHGKGKGIKADDEKTVPGCYACHYELDQGKNLSKQERRDYWDAAYDRWRMDRERLMAKNVACLKTKSAKRAQVHMLVQSLVKGMKGAQHGRD